MQREQESSGPVGLNSPRCRHHTASLHASPGRHSYARNYLRSRAPTRQVLLRRWTMRTLCSTGATYSFGGKARRCIS